MVCRDVEKNDLAEKYLNGQLDPATEDDFELHILECRNCQDFLEALQAVRDDLAAHAHEIRSHSTFTRGHLRWAWVGVAALFAMVCGLGAARFALRHQWNRAAPADATFLRISGEMRRGQLDSALHDVDIALGEYQTSNSEWVVRFRVQKANIFMLRGSYSEALQLLNDPLPYSLSSSDTQVQRRIAQAMAYRYLQQFDLSDRALSEAESTPLALHSSLLGAVAQARGILETDRKNYQKATAAFRAAATVAREQNLPRAEVDALASLGKVAVLQGHYDEAVDDFSAAVEKSRSLGDAVMEARSLGALGQSYSAMGDLENAQVLLHEAQAKLAQAGSVADQAHWLNSLAAVYAQEHRYLDADSRGQEALALARKQRDTNTLTECLNTLTEVALASGRLDDAEKFNREARATENARLNQFGASYSEVMAGRIAASKRHFREAEAIFHKVIEDPKGEAPLRWASEARLAQVYADEMLPMQAEREFRRAIRTAEMARQAVHGDEFRMSFLSGAIEFYDNYVDFLIRQKRPEEALQVAELSRVRVLEDGLTVNAPSSSAKAAPSSQKRVRPQEIAQKLKATLLFYWMGHNHSYLWAVTPTKTVHFELLRAAEIEPLVEAYRQAVLEIRDAPDPRGLDGKKLYTILVEPAQKLIPRGARVIVLPPETLYGLNLETLIVPDPQPHFWIEDVTLTTANSLTLLGRATTRPVVKEKNLLLVGNTEQPNADFPALSQAPAEMQKIEHYFPESGRKVLEGKQATPSAYLGNSPEDFSYLHFVAYGMASHARPLESGVILSKEGDSYELYARDIVQHHLNANLVTISASNASGSRAYSGEGLVGLSWAFLRAGAHNVIASLWEVSDASTPQLMDTLYGELSQGKAPDTALRDAKLRLLHSNSVFKKPLCWAPFQLYTGS